MVRLAAKDLEAILELTLRARSCGRLESFAEQVVPDVRGLVACDHIGYNEVDMEHRTAVVVTDPPDLLSDEGQRSFLRFVHQHPLVACQQAGDLRAQRISDHLSVRQFHRLELYQHFYKLIGTEDQLDFGLSGRTLVAIALNRSRRSFTERDVQVLELLRPHLAQAHAHVRAREEALALIAALEAHLEQPGRAVIGLDGQGQIARLSSLAADLLSAYFPADGASGSRLPAVLDAWVRARPPHEELNVTGSRGRLRIQQHQIDGRPPWRALVLTESRHHPDLAALRELGLTRRETEILRLLARGHANQEMARQLGVSPHTVRKHLERIYVKLGVHSRGEAISRALGCGDDHEPGAWE